MMNLKILENIWNEKTENKVSFKEYTKTIFSCNVEKMIDDLNDNFYRIVNTITSSYVLLKKKSNESFSPPTEYQAPPPPPVYQAPPPQSAPQPQPQYSQPPQHYTPPMKLPNHVYTLEIPIHSPSFRLGSGKLGTLKYKIEPDMSITLGYLYNTQEIKKFVSAP